MEGEILACGTGITASDIAYYLSKGRQVDKFEVSLKAKGGVLHVSFRPFHESECTTFSEVRITAPAKLAFKGEVLYDYANFSEY